MKVGIIGSGDVGQKLGDGFIELGHQVMIGSRDPGKLSAWAGKHHGSKSGRASTGTFEQAAKFGDVIVIATLWAGTKSAIEMAGPQNFAGKTVIDVTNPLDFSTMPPKLAIGCTDSAGETVQRMLPDAKVVKAFNTVGNPHMFRPDFPGGRPTMFICGNDEQAKKMVTDVLTAFGWESVDIGGIEGSRLLEPLAMLWITYYFRTNTGNHAFKLLRK
ncbi:NADPH-dependent F420 reductase [Nitrososphaera sp.]|uniref:NADPH-dependent F420 reductase n=1 Tax=Nitrososphaera sp. TaxID=1971748 RepID=UPI00307F8542